MIKTVLTINLLTQRVCMKPSGELWVAVGNEGYRLRKVVLAHGRLKVGERFLPRLTLPVSPVHEEADHDPTHHAQDQQAVGAADPAASIVESRHQKLLGIVAMLEPHHEVVSIAHEEYLSPHRPLVALARL